MEIKNIKKIVLSISIILLVLSLTQKCYCTSSECGDSIIVFLFGFFSVIFGGATLCWFANPLLLFSWIFFWNNKVSYYFSAFSTIIAISFLFFDEILDNEAGHYNKIIGYATGYWLWLGSNLVMLIGNIIIIEKQKNILI